jgi:hypothetical protein
VTLILVFEKYCEKTQIFSSLPTPFSFAGHTNFSFGTSVCCGQMVMTLPFGIERNLSFFVYLRCPDDATFAFHHYPRSTTQLVQTTLRWCQDQDFVDQGNACNQTYLRLPILHILLRMFMNFPLLFPPLYMGCPHFWPHSHLLGLYLLGDLIIRS